MFTIEMIEYAGYVYLRTLSLNATIEIVQVWFNQEVLSKPSLLKHLTGLIDSLPESSQVSVLFKPSRSGYYAFDGMWFKYKGQDLVLLICLDVETLDLVSYHLALDENYQSWGRLMAKAEKAEPGVLFSAKGFFSDGELGLLKQFKEKFPTTPKQLCAFHKYSRIGQIIPLKRATGNIKLIKEKVEKVLFAPSKEEAIAALEHLKRYASKHQENKKLRQVVGVLKRNFDLLLTHFDNPSMSPYNNVLEGFNHLIKRKLRLTKGFKKEMNVNRWIKFILLNYRFHKINCSKFKKRNGKSPLELANVKLPKHFNWMKLLRKKSQ